MNNIKTGLTSIEILVLAGLVAIGAAVFFPEITQIKEKTNQALCINNLKQCYIAHMMYAADFNDYLVPNENPRKPDYPRVWTLVLMVYYKYITDPKIVHCPSVEPQQSSNAFCYGSWGRNFEKISELPDKYKKTPKDFILLADSWSTMGQKEMWFFGDYRDKNYVIHCRHNQKANILFLDGHVEPVEAERLKKGVFAPFTPAVLVAEM